MIRFSAPGKLFLLGEYAVLGGAPALVTAVNRRVTVERHEDAAGYVLRGGEADPILPEAIRQAAREELEADVIGLDHLRADVTQMTTHGIKLGLGSSAASSVALAAAMVPEDPLDPERIFRIADRGHRAFQGGRGSGADVSAATFGGTFSFRVEERDETFPDLGRDGDDSSRRPVRWPGGLRVEAVWVGEPASSSAFVQRVREQMSPSIRGLLRGMASVASAAILAFELGEVEPFLANVERYDEAMQRLGEAIGLDIATEIHRALREQAKPHGVVAKPSGAGGGDISLLFGPVDADWDTALAASPPGSMRLDLAFDEPGVRREELT